MELKSGVSTNTDFDQGVYEYLGCLRSDTVFFLDKEELLYIPKAVQEFILFLKPCHSIESHTLLLYK